MRRKLLGLLAAALALGAGGFMIGCSLSAPRYRGPATDHFNGEKFVNPNGVHAQEGLKPLLKWYLHRDKGPFPARPDAPYGPKPPTRVGGGRVRLTFVNHASWLVQVDSLNLLLDPVWSERVSPFSWVGPKRTRPPGLRFEDLPPIDAVLISHNHYDHLDVPTLRRLLARGDRPQFFAGLGVDEFLKGEDIPNATGLDWWQSRPLPHGVTVVSVPAQHFSGRGLRDRDAELWTGFVLRTSAGNLYYAGDTGYGPHFQEIARREGPIRLALLPIGAYRPRWFMQPIHTSPADAVQAHLDLQARQSLGTHFGTFQLADDGLTEPVTDLHQALQAHSLPDSVFRAPTEGVGWELK